MKVSIGGYFSIIGSDPMLPNGIVRKLQESLSDNINSFEWIDARWEGFDIHLNYTIMPVDCVKITKPTVVKKMKIIEYFVQFPLSFNNHSISEKSKIFISTMESFFENILNTKFKPVVSKTED